MSDPVTNVEIEDVLSSIRKLVADDARTAPPAPKPQPDKLVLTPALRVRDDDALSGSGQIPHKAVPQTIRPPLSLSDQEHRIDDIPGDARLADFGDVEGRFPDLDAFEEARDVVRSEVAEVPEPQIEDPEPARAPLDLGKLIEQEVAAALDSVSQTQDPVEDAVADDAMEYDQPADWDVAEPSVEDMSETPAPSEDDEVQTPFIDQIDTTEPEPLRPADVHDIAERATTAPPLTLEEKVAALGRLVARETDFEDERDRPDADELTSVAEPMTWPDAAPEDAFEPVVEAEDTEAADATLPEPEDADESATLEASGDDAMQTVQVDDLPSPSDVPENEAPSDPEVGITEAASAPEDVAEPQPELRAEIAEDTATSTAVAPIPAEQNPVMALDEDILRDIVGDIVRQELQGALGERITRNVRKLVRREIHRMLVSQELE